MEKPYEELKSFFDRHRDDMIAMWKDFIETPSWARNREAAMKMGDKLVSVFHDMGLRTAEHDVGPVNSRIIEAFWGEDRPGKPILFGGHCDTVNNSLNADAKPGDVNEFDGTPHFRIDDTGKAYGLGALDMKGGLVMAIWIVKALQEIGWNERPVRFLIAGDEDKGHYGGNSPEMLVKLARGALLCFNMETGRITNEICVGRKGGGEGEMWVEGVAAHAGNDFARGRNAITEMAHKILQLSSLTNTSAGTTVAPTIIDGGTVANGIPGNCHIYFDARYTQKSEQERVKKAFHDIASHADIEGTKTSYVFKEFMGPFTETKINDAIADFVSAESVKQGFGPMKHIFLGGCSDASYFQEGGVPTVCSMRVRGEFNHTAREYAVVDSMFERAKIIGCSILDLQEFVDEYGLES